MPLYRVQLTRTVVNDPVKNPFSAHIDVLKPVPATTTTREWEFEAKSEREVRRLFKEAIVQKLPHVVGFELHSIERVKP